jgi:hypothetical protein
LARPPPQPNCCANRDASVPASPLPPRLSRKASPYRSGPFATPVCVLLRAGEFNCKTGTGGKRHQTGVMVSFVIDSSSLHLLLNQLVAALPDYALAHLLPIFFGHMCCRIPVFQTLRKPGGAALAYLRRRLSLDGLGRGSSCRRLYRFGRGSLWRRVYRFFLGLSKCRARDKDQ